MTSSWFYLKYINQSVVLQSSLLISYASYQPSPCIRILHEKPKYTQLGSYSPEFHRSHYRPVPGALTALTVAELNHHTERYWFYTKERPLKNITGSPLRIEERTYRHSLTTDAICQTLNVLQVKMCTSYRDHFW